MISKVVDSPTLSILAVDEPVVVPFFRTEFNYDMQRASLESGLTCLDESLAVQESAEEVDINTIVRRFGLTGQLPENLSKPQYADFTGITDYQTALNAVREAGEQFMELPGELRYRFNNDPQRYLQFVEDPANLEEMIKLGLAVRRPLEGPPGGAQAPVVAPGSSSEPLAPGAPQTSSPT